MRGTIVELHVNGVPIRSPERAARPALSVFDRGSLAFESTTSTHVSHCDASPMLAAHAPSRADSEIPARHNFEVERERGIVDMRKPSDDA